MDRGTGVDGPSMDPAGVPASRLAGGPEPALVRRRVGPRVQGPVPVVTFILCGALILVELWLAFGGGPGAGVRALEDFGQLRARIWEGECWRLVTCTFLHGAFFHLAFNIAALLLFGSAVERWVGRWRFLGYYFLLALAGSMAYQAFSDIGNGVGASGAICGLIGFFLVGRLGRRVPGQQLVLGRRFWTWLAFALVLLHLDSLLAESIFSGVQVADSAHFGGLAAGVLAGWYHFSGSGAAGVRRRVRALTLGSLALIAVSVYGLAFPVFDWSWYLWRIDRVLDARPLEADLAASLRARCRYYGGDRAAVEIVRLEVEHGRLEAAYRYWVAEPPEDPLLSVEAGYSLYDGLYVERGECAELAALLDRLIDATDRALLARPRHPEVLNTAAWFRALRGRDLEQALELATAALEADPGNMGILNTMGWVHFARGELGPALDYLTRAVSPADGGDPHSLKPAEDMRVLGPNYLYLAVALWSRGNVAEARVAARNARRVDRQFGYRSLENHQRKMLRSLEESLGYGRIEGLPPPGEG